MTAMPHGLRIPDIAKRINRTIATTYYLSRQADFPPPRLVIGVVKYWATRDVDHWLRTRKDGRATNGGLTREERAVRRRRQ
jgi:predicted DNA-binding transcriptional regulator AlpA